MAISPLPTHPATAGNRVRLLALLEWLRAQGATVRLLHVQHEPGDEKAMREYWSDSGSDAGFASLPYKRQPERHQRWNRFASRCQRYLGISVRPRVDVDDWNDPALQAAVQAEAESFRPDAVLMIYIWFSAVLQDLPKHVLRVLDAQDVFTDRTERLLRAGISQAWYSVPRREEARGLSRFDVVLAIQPHDAEFYRTITSREVVTVGHLLPELSTGQPSREPSLLVVASANAVNVDGLRWFLKEVWPRVRAARPDASLHLVGQVGMSIAPQAGVMIVGAIPDLAPAYAACRLVISPLRGGTGLKIKTAEALAAGRIVVSTSSAAEGLEAAIGHGLIVADDADAMVRAIVHLLNDDNEVAARGGEARAFAVQWNVQQSEVLERVFSRALPTSAR